MMISKDGRKVALVKKGEVEVLNLAGSALRTAYLAQSPAGHARHVALSEGGIAVGGDGGKGALCLSVAEERWAACEEGRPFRAATAAALWGSRLVVAAEGGTIRDYTLVDGMEPVLDAVIPTRSRGDAIAVDIIDGHLLVVDEAGVRFNGVDFPSTGRATAGAARGDAVTVGDINGRVAFYTVDGCLLWEVRHGREPVVAVAISQDNNLVAAATATAVRLYRTEFGCLLREIPLKAKKAVTGVAFNSDTGMLAEAGGEYTWICADGSSGAVLVNP